jgi:hypothetical protein
MTSSEEFLQNHQHIFDLAAQLRAEDKEEMANLIYYLLHSNLDKCKIIDEQAKKLSKMWGQHVN